MKVESEFDQNIRIKISVQINDKMNSGYGLWYG